MIRMPYYPGCTLKTKARDFDASTRAVFEELGVSLVELPRWNCCGAVYSLVSDDLLRQVAPITNLIRTQEVVEKGEVDDPRLVVSCAMCFNVLKRANARLKGNPEDLKKVNDFLYLEAQPYLGKVEIIHALQLLREISFEKIKEKVKKPLKGLKVSPYYGCNLLRPKDVSIDDPENPSILEDLVESLGAEVASNPRRMRCCGSYQTVTETGLVSDLVYDILKGASMGGADIVITACPLCAFNLDYRQKEAKENHSDHKFIPAVYYSELLSIALGKGNGFTDEHFVAPQPVLAGFFEKEKGGI
ncbi:MAG: CoB--CoM heterodisulfide reductase iron-sulfur subunit B family protein [Caldiserica bacterium]|jgi:heterodisulfide reductase subunit B|nr:CoB--CoM heterodisulfide reductase iron-sulfur subunit B family protein [Caldisericota bacterium]MDH7561800.1 CoB--CoM heterodisulfide reductase iron-sulfur subunit B family protein [Caldisericota bacterium]